MYQIFSILIHPLVYEYQSAKNLNLEKYKKDVTLKLF